MKIIRYFVYYSLVVMSLFITSHLFAQTPNKVTSTPIVKFKPPVTKSFLGKFTGNNAAISVEEGKAIIKEPLLVVDEKNNQYVISSYQFVYRRIGVTEDDSTGALVQETDIASDRFTTTPLPVVWQTNIADQLHSGEELYFFDIIVLDKQNRRFFAPELKIMIK